MGIEDEVGKSMLAKTFGKRKEPEPERRQNDMFSDDYNYGRGFGGYGSGYDSSRDKFYSPGYNSYNNGRRRFHNPEYDDETFARDNGYDPKGTVYRPKPAPYEAASSKVMGLRDKKRFDYEADHGAMTAYISPETLANLAYYVYEKTLDALDDMDLVVIGQINRDEFRRQILEATSIVIKQCNFVEPKRRSDLAIKVKRRGGTD